MKLKQLGEKRSLLFIGFFSLFATLCFLALSSFSPDSVEKNITIEQLTISSPEGKGAIVLGFKNNVPHFLMKDENGVSTLEIEGGAFPNVLFKNKENKITARAGSAPSGGVFTLYNEAEVPTLQIQGGETSGLFLKNKENRTIASLAILQDGGGGFGLANAQGSAASILKGGNSPSISFFSASQEPSVALGILQDVPHLFLSGSMGSEGILMHGGKPASMIFVDEAGKVKILISKKGVFQGKEQNVPPFQKKESKKVFSFEDQRKLFPDVEGSTH